MTVREDFNRAPIGALPDMFRVLALGDFLAGNVPQFLRHQDPVAVGGYGVASTEMVSLDYYSRASSIQRATSRAGTSTGDLTVDGYSGTAPAAAHIGISPDGNLMFAPSSDVTNVDVYYTPERGVPVELVRPVSSNAIALPSSITDLGAVLLMEAESLEGTLTGLLRVQLPSGSAASSGCARFDLAKANVKFAAANAVTRARVLLLVSVSSDEDLQKLLQSDSQFI